MSFLFSAYCLNLVYWSHLGTWRAHVTIFHDVFIATLLFFQLHLGTPILFLLPFNHCPCQSSIIQVLISCHTRLSPSSLHQSLLSLVFKLSFLIILQHFYYHPSLLTYCFLFVQVVNLVSPIVSYDSLGRSWLAYKC